MLCFHLQQRLSITSSYQVEFTISSYSEILKPLDVIITKTHKTSNRGVKLIVMIVFEDEKHRFL